MNFLVKEHLLPQRCEICHQSDVFDKQKNYCNRCVADNLKVHIYMVKNYYSLIIKGIFGLYVGISISLLLPMFVNISFFQSMTWKNYFQCDFIPIIWTLSLAFIGAITATIILPDYKRTITDVADITKLTGIIMLIVIFLTKLLSNNPIVPIMVFFGLLTMVITTLYKLFGFIFLTSKIVKETKTKKL